MASERECKQLADRIREILGKGMTLSHDVMHYLESMHSVSTSEELRERLTDFGDSESASLRELIFTPCESTQLHVEDLLAEYEFQKADEQNVTAMLLERPVETELFPPDRHHSLVLNMPRSNVEGFVSQLNLARPMDERLTAALQRSSGDRLCTAVNIRLRNRRFDLTDHIVEFFIALAKSSDTEAEDLLSCFEFMIALFEESPCSGDIYGLLAGKKRFYFKVLQAAEKAQSLWKTSNMETLMLQGVRSPHLDPADAEWRMAIIDRICLIVFGRIESLEGRETAVCTNELSRRRGIEGDRDAPLAIQGSS